MTQEEEFLLKSKSLSSNLDLEEMIEDLKEGRPIKVDPEIKELCKKVLDYMEYLKENPLTEEQKKENIRRWAEWCASFDD